MKSVNIIYTAAIQNNENEFNLNDFKTNVVSSLKDISIYTRNISIDMNAGEYPSIRIEGILGENIWPK